MNRASGPHTFNPEIEELDDSQTLAQVVEVLEAITFKTKTESKLLSVDKGVRDFLLRCLKERP
jgi:hypothetical protein